LEVVVLRHQSAVLKKRQQLGRPRHTSLNRLL
jgi:hypothetical protein